ncbi:MAG: hypothetical protein ACLTER_12830 [Ruminococcus sp.]
MFAGAILRRAYGGGCSYKGRPGKREPTTDSNGAVILKNLYLGSYVVRNAVVPENFTMPEEKEVVLS